MSQVLQIQVVIDPSLVDPDRLDRLLELTRDYSPVLATIGDIFEEELAENFEMQGFGQWAQLKRSTWEEKDRLGYSGQPPEARSGDMFRGLTQRDAPGHKFLVSADSVCVGVYGDVIPYAYWQDTGTRVLPARILAQVRPETVDRLIQLIIEWLGGAQAGVNVYADASIRTI